MLPVYRMLARVGILFHFVDNWFKTYLIVEKKIAFKQLFI